ncbi:hypothetical protein NDU88_001225 [Pleurodeles waltl]|uniref:Uncharacterized protein n=1 Tax=Pleurodeles waltl TaxID=8319 RepID=A0AAV7S9V2_PLEWA|nr:hypothetical protein NDU88_001225 [Pleurodeles waltl]
METRPSDARAAGDEEGPGPETAELFVVRTVRSNSSLSHRGRWLSVQMRARHRSFDAGGEKDVSGITRDRGQLQTLI